MDSIKEKSMITIKCKACSKTWKGRDEHEAESNANMNPCKCAKEAEEMSEEELLAKIKETT